MQNHLRRNLTTIMTAALIAASAHVTAFAAQASGPALVSGTEAAEDISKSGPSLRMSASVDPSDAPEMIRTKDGRTAKLAGIFKTTAYCFEDGNSSMTASGKHASVSHTVAADFSVLPQGTEIVVDGQVYKVEDTGVTGNVVDFYLDSAEACEEYGVQYKNIYIIEGSSQKSGNTGDEAQGPGRKN